MFLDQSIDWLPERAKVSPHPSGSFTVFTLEQTALWTQPLFSLDIKWPTRPDRTNDYPTGRPTYRHRLTNQCYPVQLLARHLNFGHLFPSAWLSRNLWVQTPVTRTHTRRAYFLLFRVSMPGTRSTRIATLFLFASFFFFLQVNERN